ncbi:hypothetical protein MACJ_001491 [Theileria orientalis]|uniref:Uncharacterized protein n=1 Tax=Theileria orientalis TaxID=68886 RepID=A0A976MA96_THEOR|nr:hypothetical protein MACJ_001491 [Theileria orientalis]
MLIRNSLCNEYLGCGYNLLYNKKQAEESEDNDVIDTNYKNPVVKFSFSGDMSNINSTLQYLHPDGTYIYSSPNCSIKQEVSYKCIHTLVYLSNSYNIYCYTLH